MRPYGKTYRKSKVHKAKECRLCAERVGSKKTQRQRNKREDTVTLKETIKAAEEGDDYAQHSLGAMYYYGQGVRHDPKKARYWFSRAAEQHRREGGQLD